MTPRVLVAGIGNVFHADDGFGVEVAGELSRRALPEGVTVVDFGIRGFDLACALLDGGYDEVWLVDAVSRGGAPGTLYLIEPEGNDEAMTQTHGMDPASVLGWVRSLEVPLGPVRLVGCEPADLGSDEEIKIELSPRVREAVPRAAELIENMLRARVPACTS